MARIYPSTSELCWQGCGGHGTLLHLWWDCPVIVPFWKDFRDQVLGLDIPLSLVHFLLHVSPMLMSQYKNRGLPHLLNTAKRLLPIYWKQKSMSLLY